MTKRRPYRHQCEGKTPAREEAARASAREREREYPAERWDAYKCPWCGHWHIGHHRGSKRRQ